MSRFGNFSSITPLARVALTFLSVVGGFFFAAGPANAALLAPGATILAVAEAGQPSGGVIVGGPLAAPFVSPAGFFSGTLTSTVISGDTTNPFPGGLTFTYLFTNNVGSAHSLTRLTVNGFDSFSTDVSYLPGGVGAAPFLADRSTTNVVGNSFAGAPVGGGVVTPGTSSLLLVVQTNSPIFRPSFAGVINGDVATVATFAPIPEPASAVLAGSAIVAFGLLIRNRRRS